MLLLTAATSSLALLIALRTVGGLSTALVFILGASLAAAIRPARDPRRRGALVGIYVAGVGGGMLLAGTILPVVLQGGAQRWPQGWLALGLLSAAALPLAWRAARRVPEPAGGSRAWLPARERRQLAPTLAGYGLFGAGYAGYMTFIIALLQKQGGSSAQTTGFWLVLGLVATVSTVVWGRVLGAFRGGRGPALVFMLAMLGTLPVLLHPGPAAMLASAVLFGGSFLAGPAAVAIVAQRQVPAMSLTAAIALLTAGFALGQAIGPVLAGAISDAAGSIAAGLWVSPVLLGLAAGAIGLQRPAGRADQPTPAPSAALPPR